MAIRMAEELAQVRRKFRRPSTPFQLRHKPFSIQPFMCAPVLPGETLHNLQIQSRVVTDPIKNPLTGWWLDYMIFYVPHIAMDGAETFKSMMLDPSTDLSSYTAAADVKYYHAGGGINWLRNAMGVIVPHYFREEGEAYLESSIDGMPGAQLAGAESWMNSLFDETLVTEGETVDNANDYSQEQLEQMRQTYEFLKLLQMGEMDYEDYLKTFGVSVNRPAEERKPELLKWVREWQYPSNTVNPDDGSVASAVSWAVRDRGDKKFLFKYPGFIVGVTVARPKMFMARQYGSATIAMDNARYWLPAVMAGDGSFSLREYANNAGPLNGANDPTNGYLFDVKDLLLYGEQFVNFALTATDANMAQLPTAALQRRYPAETDVDALFVADTAEYVRQDGICNLAIMARLEDTTPRHVVTA